MTKNQNNSNVLNRRLRITAVIGVIVISLVAAFVAIFIFNVAINTVLTYGLLGLFVISHLFMHGGHGGHSNHGNPQSDADGPAKKEN